MQTFIEMQQLCLFTFAKLCHRNTRPTAHHKRNRLFRDFFTQTARFCILAESFGLFGKFLFDVHNLVVLEFRSTVQVVTGFRLFHLVLCGLQGFLQILNFGKCSTAILPTSLHLLYRSIRHGKFFTEFFQALHAIAIRFLRKRLLLDFHLEFLTLQSIQSFRHGIHLRFHKACRLVNQVNGFIRQESITDVTVRKFHSRHKRVIVQTHAMVRIKTILNATQNRNCFVFARFVYLHWLESTFQSGIFFNVLAVFLSCRRANAMEFATSEFRLEHVAQIHRAFGLARAHNVVEFIDEHQRIAIFFDSVNHIFKTLFKVATVFCTSHQRRQIKCKDLLALQSIRHITAVNTFSKAFDNRGLTHARFTDQARIVLCLTAQYQNHTTDFFFTANHRRKLSICRHFHKFTTIKFQRRLFFSIRSTCKRVRKPRFHNLGRSKRIFKHLRKRTVTRELHQCHEQIARRHHTAHLTRRLHSRTQNTVQVAIRFHIRIHAIHARDFLNKRFQTATQIRGLNALGLIEFFQSGIGSFDKPHGQMSRSKIRMRAAVAQALRFSQNFFCIVSKIGHITPSFLSPHSCKLRAKNKKRP